MNTIEALQALKEGKKIANKEWKEDNYYRLKKHHLVNKAGKEVTYSLRFGTQGDITKDEWKIYVPPILDDVEKQYLSSIIAPFRDEVLYITLKTDTTNFQYRRLEIEVLECREPNCEISEHTIKLPAFPKGNMYKNMNEEQDYSLKELGL